MPGTFYEKCPPLSIKMSLSIKRDFYRLTLDKKSSPLSVHQRTVTPKPCLLPVTATMLPVSPTGRIRNCLGPHLWVSLTFLLKSKTWHWFPVFCVALNLPHYHSEKYICKVFLFLLCPKHFGATQCIKSKEHVVIGADTPEPLTLQPYMN